MSDKVTHGRFFSTDSVRSASHQACKRALLKKQYLNEAVIQANQKRAIISYFK